MEHEKLILSLQRRLTTLSLSHRLAMLCLLEQTLKEQHAVLAEAYRDRLRARRTRPTDRTGITRSGSGRSQGVRRAVAAIEDSP
jgi:hypothetical protein